MAMGPIEAEPPYTDGTDGGGGGGGGGEGGLEENFSEFLGPDCVIKRVDKDKKVVGDARPDEFQSELMMRASAQKRLGACAEHVKNMSRAEKLVWALDLKDKGNEFYASSNFSEAAQLYNDCLVALDFDGTMEENREVATKLQLPVCTNLAACMVEMGQNSRCVEICDVALGVDSRCVKALYRRGLAHYRLADYVKARPDFEAALQTVVEQRARARDGNGRSVEEEARGLDDLERRIRVYLGHIRRFTAQERQRCQRMFEEPLYSDRPDAPPEREKVEPSSIDDSDEAIEAALAQIQGEWRCCPCRARAREAKLKTD